MAAGSTVSDWMPPALRRRRHNGDVAESVAVKIERSTGALGTSGGTDRLGGRRGGGSQATGDSCGEQKKSGSTNVRHR